MTKEQQDLVWACLPKEVRKEIKEIYQAKVNSPYDAEIYQELILDEIFGLHNLTLDIEPKEMLMVERKKVIDIHSQLLQNKSMFTDGCIESFETKAGLEILNYLFSDKCPLEKEVSCTESEKITKDIEKFHSNHTEQ